MNIHTKLSTKIISAATILTVAGGLLVAVPAFASTGFGHGAGMRAGFGMHGTRPAAFGTVTSVSGDIITINSRQGFGSTTTTAVLTVDATNATIIKDNATSTIASVAVGDKIAAQGTLTGTNVVATSIRDGVMRPGMTGTGQHRPIGNGGMGSSTPSIGNGEPVVAGTVASVNGSSVTITTKSNVTYTVDASNAKILAGQQTSSVSAISVGDTVLVQGTVNGTSVTASSVIDQSHTASTTQNGGAGKKGPSRGFLGGVGGFFMHIFGF